MKVERIAVLPMMGQGAGNNADGGFFAPQRRLWLPVALAAAGLASSVIGGAQASKAARRAERRQRER